MPLDPPRPLLPTYGRTVFALAAVYVHFLLFAQFGFLAQLQSRLQEAAAVQAAMAWMGGMGLVASFAAVYLARRWGAPKLVRPALVACAVVAALSPAATAPAALHATAAAVGASVGVATVALAASLRDLVPAAAVGRTAGFATGAAYLVSNLPPLFAAPAVVRAWVPAALCLAAALWSPRPHEGQPEQGAVEAEHRWYGVGGLVVVVVAFVVLVGLDSAAFAFVQTTPALKAITWGGSGRQLLQGVVHLAAALAAGWLLDRRRLAGLLTATAALFAVAFALLANAQAAGGGPGSAWHLVTVVYAGPLYAVGISFYSTALVAFPSLAADGPGRVPRRWRAGLLFGFAGWVGSALGVGAAQQVGGLPVLAALAAVVGLPLLFLALRHRALGRLARVAGLALLLAGFGWAVDRVAKAESAVGAPAGAAERGRRVYVAEGCIHCHSSYVRPRAAHDLGWWGPHRPLDRAERPPLVGNRRQGPDLANAGNRRSALWHRLHLADPRSLDPASRMPSYAHLFAAGDRRGDDLVTYLASLGAETTRSEGSLPATAGSPRRGRELFATWCAACHGDRGRGDGPLAERFGRPSMDLGKPHFWAVSWGAGQEPVEDGLARVVRHGIAGTSMPGHEYLRDREVADLAAWVATLPGAEAP